MREGDSRDGGEEQTQQQSRQAARDAFPRLPVLLSLRQGTRSFDPYIYPPNVPLRPRSTTPDHAPQVVRAEPPLLLQVHLVLVSTHPPAPQPRRVQRHHVHVLHLLRRHSHLQHPARTRVGCAIAALGYRRIDLGWGAESAPRAGHIRRIPQGSRAEAHNYTHVYQEYT